MGKNNTESVRLNRQIIKKARMIAAALDVSLPDYLNERLAPIVDKELPGAVKGFMEQQSDPKKGKAS